jgi:hypothetical protein
MQFCLIRLHTHAKRQKNAILNYLKFQFELVQRTPHSNAEKEGR